MAFNNSGIVPEGLDVVHYDGAMLGRNILQRNVEVLWKTVLF